MKTVKEWLKEIDLFLGDNTRLLLVVFLLIFLKWPGLAIASGSFLIILLMVFLDN